MAHAPRKLSVGRSLDAEIVAPVAIIVSRYNHAVTHAMRDGAIAEYLATGGSRSDVHVFDAPGSYELPILARAAALTGRYAGVVALGCLIRGETRHDQYIAHAVAQGLMQVSLETGIPVAFGVLTVETPEQATDRAGGSRGNKGHEAMSALLDTLQVARAIAQGPDADGATPTIARALPDKTARRATLAGGNGLSRGSSRGGRR